MNIAPSRLTSRVASFVACALALLLAAPAAAPAQMYRAGDVIQPFSLVNRATGQPVSRDELAGKIVFMEWFAWWCPFCQLAARTVGPALRDAYPDGNPAGIEIIHVGVNLQANAESQTQNFLNNADFDVVLNDFTRALAGRFQNGGQPIFAIINGVAGSPSHDQWELLLHQDGYGDLNFDDNLALFRAAIDSVQPPPPRVNGITIGQGGSRSIELNIPAGHTATAEVSTNLMNWEPLRENLVGGGAPVTVQDAETRPGGRAFYRINARRNAAGAAP